MIKNICFDLVLMDSDKNSLNSMGSSKYPEENSNDDHQEATVEDIEGEKLKIDLKNQKKTEIFHS